MEKNEAINDLNAILSGLPGVDTPSLSESVIDALQDLTAELPSIENTVEVQQRVDSVKNNYEELLEYYKSLLEEVKKRKELGSYDSPRAIELESRRAELNNTIASKNEDIERVTQEIESYNAFNTSIRSMIDGYSSLTEQTKNIGASTTLLSEDDSRSLSEMTINNENYLNNLNSIATKNEAEISSRRDSLITYNGEIASATEELGTIDNEISVANEEYKATAIEEDNRNELLYQTSANGLDFANQYNKINPREKLQQIITSYSTGGLDNVGLSVALSSLKDQLSSIGINSNTKDNVILSKLNYEKSIANMEAQLTSPTVTEEEKSKLTASIKNDRLVLSSLSKQEKCIDCDVINKIDAVLTKLNVKKEEVVVQENIVPEPALEQKKPLKVVPVPVIPVKKPEIVKKEEINDKDKKAGVLVPVLSQENQDALEKEIKEKTGIEDPNEAIEKAKGFIDTPNEEVEQVNTKDATPDLISKVKNFLKKNWKRIILGGIGFAVALSFIISLKSCANEKELDEVPPSYSDDVSNDDNKSGGGGGSTDTSDETKETPDSKDLEETPDPIENPNEEKYEDYERPEEAKDTDYVLRVGEEGTNAAESISYETESGNELHYTAVGDIVTEDGAVIGQVPYVTGPEGETIVDSTKVDEALKKAEQEYQEKVDNFVEEIKQVALTGEEKPIEQVVENFTPTTVEGTNITQPENELDNINDAAADIFADFGFEEETVSMGGK